MMIHNQLPNNIFNPRMNPMMRPQFHCDPYNRQPSYQDRRTIKQEMERTQRFEQSMKQAAEMKYRHDRQKMLNTMNNMNHFNKFR